MKKKNFFFFFFCGFPIAERKKNDEKKKFVLGSWATAHLPALGHDTMELYRDTAAWTVSSGHDTAKRGQDTTGWATIQPTTRPVVRASVRQRARMAWPLGSVSRYNRLYHDRGRLGSWLCRDTMLRHGQEGATIRRKRRATRLRAREAGARPATRPARLATRPATGCDTAHDTAATRPA